MARGQAPTTDDQPVRRQHRWRRRSSTAVTVWSLVFALMGVATLGVAVWLWGANQVTRAQAAAVKQAVLAVNRRVVSRCVSPPQDVALARVKRALQVRQASEVEEYFRLGSASCETVVAYLKGLEQVDGKITGYTWLSSLDANGLLLEGVKVITQAGDMRHSRLVLLTPDDHGRWQIDFEAFARVVTPAWSEILSQTGVSSRVRVIFAQDNYYNGCFRDESLWTCYRLGSADATMDLLGYCRKGSAQAIAMARILAHGSPRARAGSVHRATLEVVRPAGAESRQFEITRVLAEDWVVSAIPFDRPGR